MAAAAARSDHLCSSGGSSAGVAATLSATSYAASSASSALSPRAAAAARVVAKAAAGFSPYHAYRGMEYLRLGLRAGWSTYV